MSTAGKVTVGILSGLAIGVAAGVLIAPYSGRKTRQKLMDKSKELKDLMTASLEDVKKAYNKKIEAYAGESKHGIDSIKNSLKVN
jgi:gas vesicle protein